ncbi:MAG: AAA family ATPase [Patescibacteria group bacterium]
MKKILGVLGKPGAGKDTFCDFFEKNHNSVKVVKFSDTLTDILKMFFDNVTREDQQWLVNQLRDRFGEDVLAKATKRKIKNTDEEFVLLNGVRVWDDYEMIKEVGGQLVYIETKPKLRWERMKKRGEKADDNVSYEKFLELDKGRSEKDIEDIGEKAEFKVNNNGTKKELEDQVLDIINNLNG